MKEPSGPETEQDAKVQAASECVENALEDVHSVGDAEQVLDTLESRTEGVTLADVEADTPEPAAAEKLQDAVAHAPEEERAAVALEAAAELSTGSEADEPQEPLSSALRASLAPHPSEALTPHGYLRRAVLKRMSPLQAADANIFIAVNRLPRYSAFTHLMQTMSTLGWHGAAWVVGALALAARDGRRGRATAWEMISALMVTNALVERLIKKYFRRRRPFIILVQALVVGRKPGSWSFPSGHSATSFACASALGRRYPRRRAVFYGLASVVGFSRIYLGHHYPMDVVSGASIGEGLSRSVVWVVRKLRG